MELQYKREARENVTRLGNKGPKGSSHQAGRGLALQQDPRGGSALGWGPAQTVPGSHRALE